MNWTEKQIRDIIADMSEENPFACRALFKVSEIVFSKTVSTMAVTLSANPVLMINKTFINRYAKSENDIKAVLMHEFLHVVLGHTEKYSFNTPLLNIALDAVINAIIHRSFGPVYSDFFCRIYKWKGVAKLLRTGDDFAKVELDWRQLHNDIYKGKKCADDLYELLQYLQRKEDLIGTDQLIFLGNHDFDPNNISPENRSLLEGILKKMNGTGIWNKPGTRGVSSTLDFETKGIEKFKNNRWKKSVHNILKKCMMADNGLKNNLQQDIIMLPMISQQDRRSLITSGWAGVIPLSKNIVHQKKASETVTIYLDVSGSMQSELNQLVSLLYQFKQVIKKPIWAFSNEVEEARFKNGNLEYKSTSGTSISCVFDHIKKNRIKKSLIVTDGFTEAIEESNIHGIYKEKIWVIISADGNPQEFSKNGIKYFQLQKK